MFQTIFVEPLHNALVFLVNSVPGANVGLAIIILTVLVKFLLAPLHQKAIKGQIKLKELDPKIQEIKKNFPDKQQQAQKTFELYKENKINPLSGCLPVLIQLPIILALYRLFVEGFTPQAHKIYNFISSPESFSTMFMSIDLAEKSLILAIFAGITQYLQARFSASYVGVKNNPNDDSMQANISRMMSKQMVYFLPIFVVFVSYQISAAVALYWSVNNIFTTVQEILIYRKYKKSQNN